MGLDYDVAGINEMILKYLPERKGLQLTVINAMDEAVVNGGKRIRPILMLETYRYFVKKQGGAFKEELIAPFMAAMEMMHSASLIHDDLPCMDNDTLRRGKPTTWVTYGVDMATLAGDALMIEPFAVMAKAAMREECPENKARAVRALWVFGEKAGIRGMTGGQVVDVENDGKPLTDEQLDFIYRLKTGALLEGSMMTGAILGGAAEEDIDRIERIASDIGMAFQIRDDILDVTSTAQELGKPIGSDAENDKYTFVKIHGLEKAQEEVVRYSQDAGKLLDELGGETGKLKEIVDYLINRTN